MRENQRVSDLEASIGAEVRRRIEDSQMPSVDTAFNRLDQRLSQYKHTLSRSNLSEEDKDRLRDGLDLVFEGHGEQLRVSDIYPVHVMDVSELLFDPDGIDCRDGDTALGALFHDLGEDVKEYRENPGLIGRRYNRTVQSYMQGMITNEWPSSAKARAIRNIEASQNAAIAVAHNLEYQENVNKELYEASPVSLIKVSDLRTNAFTLGEITNDETRQRLAAKYEGVHSAAMQAIDAMAENKEDLSIHGSLESLRQTYARGEGELRGTAREWKHYDVQEKVRRDGLENLFV